MAGLPPKARARWVVIDGNHDQAKRENLARIVATVLRLLEVPVLYGRRERIGSFARGRGGPYYHAEHGSGHSSYYANSYAEIRACWKKFVETAQLEGKAITRFLRAHAHWLNVGAQIGLETAIDTTGGWHRQERLKLPSAMRRTGLLVYLHDGEELKTVEVTADLDLLVEENANPGLAFANMRRAGSALEEVVAWGMDNALW